MRRILGLIALLLPLTAHAAAVATFTMPGGTNPINNPAVLPDINKLVNEINSWGGGGGGALTTPTLTVTSPGAGDLVIDATQSGVGGAAITTPANAPGGGAYQTGLYYNETVTAPTGNPIISGLRNSYLATGVGGNWTAGDSLAWWNNCEIDGNGTTQTWFGCKSTQDGFILGGTGTTTVSQVYGHFNHFQVFNNSGTITALFGQADYISGTGGTIGTHYDLDCGPNTSAVTVSYHFCVYNSDTTGKIYNAGPLVNTAPASFTQIGLGNIGVFQSSNAPLLMSSTAPTISVGFSTSTPDAISDNNGTAFMRVTVGSTPANTTITLTLPAATNVWGCRGEDVTTPAIVLNQTGTMNTTACTLTSYSRTTGNATLPTAADKITIYAMAD